MTSMHDDTIHLYMYQTLTQRVYSIGSSGSIFSHRMDTGKGENTLGVSLLKQFGALKFSYESMLS